MSKKIYWITSEKYHSGYPAEASIYRALAENGYALQQWVWDREPLPALAPDDLVVIRTPWDYFEKFAAFTEFLDRLPTRGVHNPAEILRWNSDKAYLHELETTLVPTEWIEASSIAEVQSAMRSAFPGREKVIKPVKSAGAYHTYRFRESDLPDAQPFVRMPAMIQAFVPEILSDGERSLVFFGGELSHSIRKRPKAGDFRVQESFGGGFSQFAPTADEIRFGQNLIDAVAKRFSATLQGKPLLYGRVDYVQIDGKPHLMELELLEPDLYFHHAEGAAENFVRALGRLGF